jgi:hypothetical protein
MAWWRGVFLRIGVVNTELALPASVAGGDAGGRDLRLTAAVRVPEV